MDKLINKSYRSFDYISRYSSFPYYYDTDFSRYVYGTTSYINQDIPYIVHIVTEKDTYDSIALKYYNNPTLYWVICDFNKIQDAFSAPKYGEKLLIPTLSNISFSQTS